MKLRWLFYVLVIAFLWIVVSRFTEIQKLAETLAQGRWQWVLVAATLQVLYYIAYTGLYQSAFYTVDVESRVGELLPVTFASIFINVAAPTAGASGAALFVDDAVRRGQSAARATAGTLLVLVADFSAFTLVLLVGMLYLFLQHDLRIYEIIGALILLGIIGGLTGVLLLGLWQPGRLRRLLGWLQRLVNRLGSRLKRPDLLGEDWAERNTNEFTEAALAITTHPQRLLRTLLVALATHIIDITSLFVLFLAFHQRISFGALVAGFAIGVLFWIVSITPQGIGVVEGVMTLVYTSLGVPADRAAVISISFRGLTFWLPLAIGFFLLRRTKAFGAQVRLRSDVWSVRAVALLTGLMGVINVISSVTPTLHTRMAHVSSFSPLAIRHGGRLTATLAGFALLLLASNLWRRKRLAWLLTLIVLLISSLSHLLKGLDIEESILAAALAAWLIYLRPHFHARSDPPSVRQGIRILIVAMAFTLAYSVAGFYLMDHQFRINFGLWDAVRQTIIMFTQFYDPGLQPITHLGRYFAASIYIVGSITIGYALLMLVRPVLMRSPATLDERARARQIVESYGRSSLARMTLMEDKAYFFSRSGSFVAFVVIGRTALALGDPIGPLQDAAGCIHEFCSYCTRNDWSPAFYQVRSDYLEHYQAESLSALCIGHEAIVDLQSFTVQGRANKGLRSGVNRIQRLGYCAEFYQPPLSNQLLHQLKGISDDWLTKMHSTEKRFSLGWFEDNYVRSCPVITIQNPDGRLDAFANLVPEYQQNEIAIDMMRYRGSSEHGLMDFLFYSLFQWARDQGFQTFNLGLSGLSGIGEKPEDPAIERALHYIYEHVNQFYNFKGLHEFKEKFHPFWSPRYLIYAGLPNLPLATLALIRADSGDDLFGSYFRRV